MPGFKFHIVTVVGIFVALALGIVIGTSLSDNIIIESQMSTIQLMQNRINSLENEKSDITEQMQKLAEDNNRLHRHEEILFQNAIARYHNQDNFAVVAFSNSLELNELQIVQNNKIFFKNILLINYDEVLVSETLKEFLQVNGADIASVFSERLVGYLTTNDETSLKYLEEIGIISFNGNYDFDEQEFIFFFEGKDSDESLRTITEKMAQGDNSVFAVKYNGVNSRPFDRLNKSIPKIDNLDLKVGQVEFLEKIQENVRRVSE